MHRPAMNVERIIYVDDEPVKLAGTGYATRCAAAIAHDNVPDALWALEVLNTYGHLVQHPADRIIEFGSE